MTWAVWDRWETANPFCGIDPRSANIALNAGATNYWNTAAFDYFSDAAVAGDYLYFAITRQYWGIKLEVGTPFAASTVSFIWEYKTGGSTWATLPVTNPNALLSSGTQIVLFTPPDADWYSDREKGMAIRCRIVSVTGITEGGANATNKVQWLFKALRVTGTVSDLSSGVTADLAGSYTTLAAATPAASMTPLRMPVRSLNATDQLDIVLASGTAGAGDSVTLTGIDGLGNALVEVIDVSAGNGTYTTTRAFRDVSDVACTGWVDGTITVNQKRWGLIHNTYGNMYVFGAHLAIGDDSTTTAFTLKELTLYFVHGAFWYVMGKSTFTLGEVWNSGLAAEIGAKGCFITEQLPQLGISHTWNRIGGGAESSYSPVNPIVINIYGSHWYVDAFGYNNISIAFIASQITALFADTTFSASSGIFSLLQLRSENVELRRCKISGMALIQGYSASDASQFNTVTIGGASQYAGSYAKRLTDVAAASFRGWMYAPSGQLDLVNGSMDEADFSVGNSGMSELTDCVLLRYSFDLTVVDSDGNAISGAAVEIVDNAAAVVYSGTTDANGQIAQQLLRWKTADHVAAALVFTWTTNTPHVLTVQADGYQDYVMTFDATEARDEIVVMSSGGGSVIVIED